MLKSRLTIGLLLLSLFGTIFTITSATATADEVKWTRVNIPTEGKASHFLLASGSDIRHLTMAADGTLYAHADPSGTNYTLYKSADGGYSWSYIGEVKDTIVDIATAPDDASVLYYATTSQIYKSRDGGNRFESLVANPGGAGSNNIEITAIAVTSLDSHYFIAVGTRDTDNGQFGGIYTLDEEKILPNWQDTSLGNYDVYTLAFSPDYLADRQLVAVVTDESDTTITIKAGDSAWGATIGNARLDQDNSGSPTPVAVTTSADIAFPGDYDTGNADRVLFVAIDAGSDSGDVYRIEITPAPYSSTATDLNIGADHGASNIDVTTLAISGEADSANILAGAAGSAQVYRTTDGGKNWTQSAKAPTGQSKTGVLIAPGSDRAYAATGGTESAFSITQDGGDTWHQVSLIDTTITTILDVSPSPQYSQDNTLFLLTFGGKHSLWRSLNGGARWERIYSSALARVDTLKWVETAPEYSNGNPVIFLAGTSGGKPAIWRSKNNGQDFARRIPHNPDTGDTFNIDSWTLVNDDTLFIGSYDGSDSRVYHTTDGGWSYATGAIAGSQSLNSIVLSPSYEQDKTILVGNTNGWVYYSNDNGNRFEPLPPDATSPPLTDAITVAYDPNFSNNNTVYAASSTQDKGIYRFIIGKSTHWESIDSSLPAEGSISQIVAGIDGTLYASNLESGGGMERSLNPAYSLGPAFETITRGLEDGAILTGLRHHDHRLWSIDSHNVRLMTYVDSLTQPVDLTSPANQDSGISTRNVILEWETLKGATEYKWQLDYDTDFSTVPTGFENETRASSARMSTLESATTYYWRVRATEPVLSPWSSKWSFTTGLVTEAVTPELQSPKAGAGNVTPKPIFQWGTIAGADKYELLVSTDASFNNPTINKTDDFSLPGTAWQSNVNLNYVTTYYWKVRAVGTNTSSEWSSVGAFTVAPAPSSPAPEPPLPPALLPPPLPPTPEPPLPPPSPPTTTQPDIPSWGVVYLIGGLMLSLILLLIIMLVLVTAIRRL